MSFLEDGFQDGLRENVFPHSTHSTTFQIQGWLAGNKVLMVYYSAFSVSQKGQTVSGEL